MIGVESSESGKTGRSPDAHSVVLNTKSLNGCRCTATARSSRRAMRDNIERLIELSFPAWPTAVSLLPLSSNSSDRSPFLIALLQAREAQQKIFRLQRFGGEFQDAPSGLYARGCRGGRVREQLHQQRPGSA
jgi:hypothetical protein